MRYGNAYSCSPAKRQQNNATMDTFLDEVLQGFLGKDIAPVRHHTPQVNILENEQAFTLEFVVPGWNKSDFNIALEQHILTVEAKKETKKTEEKGAETTETKPKFLRREFRNQSIKRSFTLPKHVDTDAIEATYVNGILSLSIPKKEEVKLTKKIAIA